MSLWVAITVVALAVALAIIGKLEYRTLLVAGVASLPGVIAAFGLGRREVVDVLAFLSYFLVVGGVVGALLSLSRRNRTETNAGEDSS